MNEFRSGTKILVQRGSMGGRTVYTAQLTLREVNSLIPPHPESGALEGREQRLTDSGHAADIARYIDEVPEYFLPGIMAFLHKEPEFEPLTVDGKVLTQTMGAMWIDGRIGRSIGDGMHRAVAIEQQLGAHEDEDNEKAEDTIVVSFIVEPDRDNRRQAFNDINRTQKQVPKSLGVTYDSRDPIAIAVNNIVENDRFGLLIEREKATAGRTSGKLTTTGTLFDAVSVVAYGWSGKAGRRKGRVTQDEANQAAELLLEFVTSVKPIADVLEKSDEAMPDAATALRAESILGSGATVKALAGALFTVLGRFDGDVQRARATFKKLDELDWTPEYWEQTGFVPAGGKTPHSRAQEVRGAGLHIADHLTS
jgi:DNA sulfur modification protein DndB